MGPAQPIIPSHFETKEQHNEVNVIGMWLFIAQEIMFFGGLFTAYFVYRLKYPDAWAVGSAELNTQMGAMNTFFLLISSLTMASTVYFTQTDKFKPMIACFCSTMFFGALFLFVKYFEYKEKFLHHLVPGPNFHPEHLPVGMEHPEAVQLFFILYFTMTGMHAFHMIIGLGIATWLLVLACKRKFGPNKYMPMEIFGFYWHFVDIVWVFLFPMIYLIPEL